MTPRPFLMALLTVLAAASLASAAEQPREAPSEFQNGQNTAFGSVEMAPYVMAGGDPVAIEARFTVKDIAALQRAALVLLALNLHSDEARLTVDGAFASDGSAIPVERTGTADHGLQQQLFVQASELTKRAQDGQVAFTLRGHAAAKDDGQVHVGALLVAFTDAWAPVSSVAGPGQLYGYSLVQATGISGGVMPFHGQGNSWLVAPLAMVAGLALLAGSNAVVRLARMPPAPAPSPASRTPSPVPTFGSSRSTTVPVVQPVQRVPPPAPVPPASAVPTFGSVASPRLATQPVLAPRPAVIPHPGVAAGPGPAPGDVGPMQGPLLPPGGLNGGSTVARAPHASDSPRPPATLQAVRRPKRPSSSSKVPAQPRPSGRARAAVKR